MSPWSQWPYILPLKLVSGGGDRWQTDGQEEEEDDNDGDDEDDDDDLDSPLGRFHIHQLPIDDDDEEI